MRVDIVLWRQVADELDYVCEHAPWFAPSPWMVADVSAAFARIASMLPEDSPFRFALDALDPRKHRSIVPICRALATQLRYEALTAEWESRRTEIQPKATESRRAFLCSGCGNWGPGYHGDGCDQEKCGKCGGQYITCGCEQQEAHALVHLACRDGM